jgi:hypothetical protein
VLLAILCRSGITLLVLAGLLLWQRQALACLPVPGAGNCCSAC